MKRFLYLLCALAFCLALTPSTALAADEFELYVSGQQITQSGCYENQNGTWTKVDGAEPAAGQFCYDAVNSALTLNGTTISHNQSVVVGGGAMYLGSLIAYSQSADVSLHLVLQGDNSITGTGGIRVMSNGGDVSLSISGPGSLTADVGGYIDSGITLIGSKDANLNIDGADVTASSNVCGVELRAGEGYVATATINDGNLTASGSIAGIYYSRPFGGTTGGPSSLTVSGNAVVDTEGGTKGIVNSRLNSFQVGADGESGGIVWDGNTGTVYGDVTLQDDLTINEGETLTIGTDASLTIPDGKTLTNNGTITNDGTINIQNGGTVSGTPTGGTVVHAPGITEQPQNQTVDEGATAKFTVEATGGNLSYQWQQITDGKDWTDISGANSDTYTTEAATTDMNGRKYRCKVSNNAGSVTSNAATLTVNQHEHQWGEPAWTWSEDGKTATAKFTCAKCNETQNVNATVTPTVTTDPTCTGNGTTTYTATATLDGKDYTATKDVADIPATGHKWSGPNWTWNGTKATATFTCKNDASHTQVRNATVTSTVKKAPTDTENGVTEYKATVTFGGKTYTAVRDLADIPATGPEWDEDDFVQVLRLYNPYSGEHLYTMDEVEYAHLVSIGWNGEDLAFYARPKDGSMGGYEVYRLYNRYSGRHHLTASVTERDALVRLGWTCEGVAFRYSDEDPTIWRGYDRRTDDHLWTTSRHELDVAVSNGWNDEGIAYGVGAKTDVD